MEYLDVIITIQNNHYYVYFNIHLFHNTECPRGEPLPRLNCGLRINPDQCPKGYFCSVDEIDRFAVCCRGKWPFK